MTDVFQGREPTPDEKVKIEKAHEVFLMLANSMGGGGLSTTMILEAMSSAQCDIIAAKRGPTSVAPYFEFQAERALKDVHAAGLTGRSK